MTQVRLSRGLILVAIVAATPFACSRKARSDADAVSGSGASVSDSGVGGISSTTDGGGAGGNVGADAQNVGGDGGDRGAVEMPTPRYYPVEGFEDCIHAEVKANCKDGWCKLPASCFVMGAPEDEWHFADGFENQAAVKLTNSIEVQRVELMRAEWMEITGLEALGPDTCTEPNCPVAMVSWWDAITAADLLSEKRGLALCYEPVDCTGTLGIDLECTGVADPEKSVYECEGYRMGGRGEAGSFPWR